MIFWLSIQNDPGKNNKIKEKVRNQLRKTFIFLNWIDKVNLKKPIFFERKVYLDLALKRF